MGTMKKFLPKGVKPNQPIPEPRDDEKASEYLKYISHPRKQKFLIVYAETGSIRKACKIVGMPRRLYHYWFERDAAFAEAARYAHQEAIERAVDEVRRRGIKGIKKPVFYKGERVASVREYSDPLLMFYLRGMAPQFKDASPVQQHIGGERVDVKTYGFNLENPQTVALLNEVLRRSVDRPDEPPAAKPIPVSGQIGHTGGNGKASK